jgi:hypothetical protein
MRSDPQGFISSQKSAHRNLRSHLLHSQIKPQKKKKKKIRFNPSSWKRLRCTFSRSSSRRDCGWEEKKDWWQLGERKSGDGSQTTTTNDTTPCACVSLCMSLKKKQETLMCVCVCVCVCLCSEVRITNSEEPLREFWMNEEKGFILKEMGFVH